MNLRRLTLTALLSLVASMAMGQSISRSQFAHYDSRKDSDSAERTTELQYIAFSPEARSSSLDGLLFVQSVEAQQSWSDENIYLHIESVGGAYELSVNGRKVATTEDSLSPAEYDITSYIQRGENSIEVLVRPSALSELEQGIAKPSQPRFSGSYISRQSRLKIFDYLLRVESDDSGEHARLFIDIIVENRFNFEETIEVGYDVYDPSGKLLEFNTDKVTLEGNSRDTVSFSPYLYGAAKSKWGTASQPLYSVTLYTKANRVSQTYLPFKVGYKAALPSLKVASYNASASEKLTLEELRKLKKEGYNCVAPSYPQPLWFYESCDKVGLYVIDCVAISATESSDNRAVGGTPSNNPALVEEYLDRVDKAYFRTRNFTSVIAYSLSSTESGNGYNMYKAYQHLKALESQRPILYRGAQGEWNSDEIGLTQ